MKSRILFVDDDSNVLQGLRRMLRSRRHEWDIKFAQSGSEALDMLGESSFDVVVSDMRMPGMDGASLLNEIMNRHPKVARIVLSGQSDQQNILRSVGPAHQYLSKPCDAETLKKTIQRTCALKKVLSDEGLEGIVSQLGSLPTLPSLYLELKEEIESSGASLKRVGEIISRDVAMTAKILQLVNSAFFGLPRHVVNPAQAVTLLGLETVRALVLSVGIFDQFKCRLKSGLDQSRLWGHSRHCAAFARQVALAEGLDEHARNEAFLAAFLHDIGKLVLASKYTEHYRAIVDRSLSEQTPLTEIERQELKVTHGEVGAYLVGLWGLPDFLVEVLAYHHRPAECLHEDLDSLAIVHFANNLSNELFPPSAWSTAPRDDAYLLQVVSEETLSGWRKVCLEFCEQQGDTN